MQGTNRNAIVDVTNITQIPDVDSESTDQPTNRSEVSSAVAVNTAAANTSPANSCSSNDSVASSALADEDAASSTVADNGNKDCATDVSTVCLTHSKSCGDSDKDMTENAA